MEERASGIILRTRPFTETSLVVEWLTEDAGRISTVAKGARRPKSPFIGKLDLFYEADFSFVRSQKSVHLAVGFCGRFFYDQFERAIVQCRCKLLSFFIKFR